MDYKIYPIKKHQIISIDISGEQIHEAVGKALTEAVQIARKHGFNRFLMDLQNSVLLDTITDTYIFVENVDKLGFERTDRFAGVVKEQLEHHIFSENVAVNRGWQVKYFEDREKAKKWLVG